MRKYSKTDESAVWEIGTEENRWKHKKCEMLAEINSD
jgi:hypothetical protein